MPLAISPWVLLSVLSSLVQMVAVPSGAGVRAVVGAIYHLVQGLQTVQPTHYLKKNIYFISLFGCTGSLSGGTQDL